MSQNLFDRTVARHHTRFAESSVLEQLDRRAVVVAVGHYANVHRLHASRHFLQRQRPGHDETIIDIPGPRFPLKPGGRSGGKERTDHEESDPGRVGTKFLADGGKQRGAMERLQGPNETDHEIIPRKAQATPAAGPKSSLHKQRRIHAVGHHPDSFRRNTLRGKLPPESITDDDHTFCPAGCGELSAVVELLKIRPSIRGAFSLRGVDLEEIAYAMAPGDTRAVVKVRKPFVDDIRLKAADGCTQVGVALAIRPERVEIPEPNSGAGRRQPTEASIDLPLDPEIGSFFRRCQSQDVNVVSQRPPRFYERAVVSV